MSLRSTVTPVGDSVITWPVVASLTWKVNLANCGDEPNADAAMTIASNGPELKGPATVVNPDGYSAAWEPYEWKTTGTPSVSCTPPWVVTTAVVSVPSDLAVKRMLSARAAEAAKDVSAAAAASRIARRRKEARGLGICGSPFEQRPSVRISLRRGSAADSSSAFGGTRVADEVARQGAVPHPPEHDAAEKERELDDR